MVTQRPTPCFDTPERRSRVSWSVQIRLWRRGLDFVVVVSSSSRLDVEFCGVESILDCSEGPFSGFSWVWAWAFEVSSLLVLSSVSDSRLCEDTVSGTVFESRAVLGSGELIMASGGLRSACWTGSDSISFTFNFEGGFIVRPGGASRSMDGSNPADGGGSCRPVTIAGSNGTGLAFLSSFAAGLGRSLLTS